MNCYFRFMALNVMLIILSVYISTAHFFNYDLKLFLKINFECLLNRKDKWHLA